MTIDLDAIRGAIGYVHAPKLDEVFRLARLGQQREQERCGRCKFGRMWYIGARLGDLTTCDMGHGSDRPDWHCADWEEGKP